MNLSELQLRIIRYLFQHFTEIKNSSEIAAALNVTRQGVRKAISPLLNRNILKSKVYGRAIFYTLSLNSTLARKILELALVLRAEKYQKFHYDVEEMKQHSEIIILFGSALKKEKPNDIDILFVGGNERLKKVSNLIAKKNQVLLSPIHPIIQLPKDLRNNFKKKDKVLIEIVKTGVVLYGYRKLVEEVSKCHISIIK